MFPWMMPYGLPDPEPVSSVRPVVPQRLDYTLSQDGSALWLKYESYRPGFISTAIAWASERYHPSDVRIVADDGKILWTGKTKKVQP